MGRLGGEGDELVVALGRGVDHPAKAHGPSKTLHPLHRPVRRAGVRDNIGRPHENAGVAGGKSAVLLPGHGMPRHKGIVAPKALHPRADGPLHAAGIRQHAALLQHRAGFLGKFQRPLRVHTEIHQIRGFQVVPAGLAVNGPAGAGVQQGVLIPVYAQHLMAGVLFQGLGNRAPDEPQAHNHNLHRARTVSHSLPTLEARASNWSGVMDWAPSQRAWLGSLWTSMIRPSAPMAAADRAR